MDDGSQSTWLIVILLLLAAMLFAVMETAFASVSRVRLKTGAEKGEKRAERALFVTEHFDRAITTLLICTNIVHLATASIVTVYVTKRWGVSAVSISTLITTLVVFFFGEMLPKSIARKYSEPLSLATAGILCALMTILRPAAALLTWIGNTAARMTKGEIESSVTENDIYDIIEDMAEEGKIDEEQEDLISSALQFGDLTVESVLTPRMDVAALNVEADGEEILASIKAQNHSRLPVYEGSIDRIIGILQIRKYIKEYLRQGKAPELRTLLDEAFFVHQSTELAELLPMMSKQRINMAVVTDNFGGTLGIVTVEDIVEEIFGEIWDEDDVVEEPVTDLSENACIADADESVTDVFEHLNYEDPEDNDELVDTRLGEWAYQMFDSIPSPGDSFRYHELTVTVTEMEHNRILKLKVVRTLETAEGGEQA